MNARDVVADLVSTIEANNQKFMDEKNPEIKNHLHDKLHDQINDLLVYIMDVDEFNDVDCTTDDLNASCKTLYTFHMSGKTFNEVLWDIMPATIPIVTMLKINGFDKIDVNNNKLKEWPRFCGKYGHVINNKMRWQDPDYNKPEHKSLISTIAERIWPDKSRYNTEN